MKIIPINIRNFFLVRNLFTLVSLCEGISVTAKRQFKPGNSGLQQADRLRAHLHFNVMLGS